MKTNVVLEYSDLKVTEKDCCERIKDLWKADGNKLKDIKSLNLYLKPEESTVYYVINEQVSGSFSM